MSCEVGGTEGSVFCRTKVCIWAYRSLLRILEAIETIWLSSEAAHWRAKGEYSANKRLSGASFMYRFIELHSSQVFSREISGMLPKAACAQMEVERSFHSMARSFSCRLSVDW